MLKKCPSFAMVGHTVRGRENLAITTSHTCQECDNLSAIFQTNPTECFCLCQHTPKRLDDYITDYGGFIANIVLYCTVHSWLYMVPVF